MARTRKTRDSERERRESERQRKKKKKKKGRDRNGYEESEVLSIVCHYFCEGYPPGEIAELVHAKYGITLRREEPWDLLRFAASRGLFHFWPPFEIDLSGQINDRYRLEVGVARSATSDDVSRRGAEKLLRFLANNADKEEVHIGFAGGEALKRTAQFLAERLQRETGELPPKIVFHAMVAGFDVENPTSDPNAFFNYFDPETMPVDTSFVGLPAPALLTDDEAETLGEIKPIQKALARKDELDIIVTSAGGHWQQKHSGLSKAYGEFAAELDADGWIGDLMWQPLTPDGPVDVETIGRRAFTLMQLDELGDFIRKGKTMLLLMGPCGQCGKPKTDVLRAILDRRPRIVTDLVVDSKTARELLA